MSVVVDQEGNFVVADHANHRIQVFNSNGEYVRKFGSYGNGNGQVQNPIGVGLLSNGNIVVAEWYGNRVQIFDSQASLFGLWVLGWSILFLLILTTTSWSLITSTVAFKFSTRMATTSKPLEPGSFQSRSVFAWIVREGLLSARQSIKEPIEFRFF